MWAQCLPTLDLAGSRCKLSQIIKISSLAEAFSKHCRDHTVSSCHLNGWHYNYFDLICPFSIHTQYLQLQLEYYFTHIKY